MNGRNEEKGGLYVPFLFFIKGPKRVEQQLAGA